MRGERELKYMTLNEASERWGVKKTTLRSRLFQDKHKGRSMHGTKKHGHAWMITEAYMDTREWRNQKHEKNN